jgi:hypothetical protein
MGGRPKVYTDLEEITGKESVRTWLQTLREGPSRKTASYSVARYLRWRKEKGLISDPDFLVNECLDGTNRTLIDHLKPIIEYSQSLRDALPATKIKAYKNVRSFYAANMVTLPKSKLKFGDDNQV